jgi:MFS family permease
MASTRGFAPIKKAFSNRQYRTYQIGRFSFLITYWMYKVAVGWMVWDLTHSVSWLGVFGFLDQAPAVFILPLAGAQADRTDCLKYMRVTQSLMLLQSVLLGLLVFLDFINIWVLAGFVLIYGTVNSAQQPASQAILPNILQKDELTAAYGLNSLTFNVSRLIGPMIAGPLIYEWGPAPAVFINAVGAIGFQVCLALMRTHGVIGKREREKGHMLRDIRDGILYARNHPGISPSMVILIFLGTFAFCIDQLLPSLADGVFHGGAKGLAWMTSAMGAGAMTLAFTIARRGAIAGLTNYVVRAMIVLAVAFAVLAMAGSIELALVCIYLIGYGTSAVRVGCMTLLQYSVDADMRGRVASFYSWINNIGPAVGSLIIGTLGDHFGIQPMMAVSAVVTLGVWAWAMTRKQRMAVSLEVDAVTFRAQNAKLPEREKAAE